MNSHPPMPSEKTPIDCNAIRRFCEILFGYLDGLVPVRIFAEKGTPPQKPWLPFYSVDEVTAQIVAIADRAAASQRAVYVVPGTVRTTGSARSEDIVQTSVILADLDQGDIRGQREWLLQHIGPASMTVVSGGRTEAGHDKLHIYWRLTEPAEGDDLKTVVEIRRQIAAKTGADASFDSLHQPIRVAGTVHGKNGIQAATRILAQTEHEYELNDLLQHVSAMPAMPKTEKRFSIKAGTFENSNNGPTARQLATQLVQQGGKDGITRFSALSRVIGHWVRNVRRGDCTVEDAWEAVQGYNQACIVPPWEEYRLQREFKALLTKDIAEKGALDKPSTPASLAAPEHSEDEIATLFVGRHVNDWRHVPAFGTWFKWTGTHWAQNETRAIGEDIRQVCRTAAANAGSAQLARRLASQKTILAVEKICSADPAISTAPQQWDAHPMLLNTPGGVINLQTGESFEHDRNLLLSQITSCTTGAGCPVWLKFLQEITDGDVDLQCYLQRLAGYCLTGETSEQVFAFLHGSGANGKSVFLQTLASVMGNYAATATIDTFMASHSDRHLTELAGLRAARLVLVPETEAKRSWNEARIKSVTGGEKIRANFMRRDHFEFTPQFKLLVAGNHCPSLESVGEAMRRRLHVVPFTVTIPPKRRDRSLAHKLATERAGILSWMLEGCAEWLKHGLAAPERVHVAAEDYFAAEDLVGQWISERCQIGPDLQARSSDLFQSWRSWADSNGIAGGTSKQLGAALKARGFVAATVARSRGWRGLRLASPSMGSPE